MGAPYIYIYIYMTIYIYDISSLRVNYLAQRSAESAKARFRFPFSPCGIRIGLIESGTGFVSEYFDFPSSVLLLTHIHLNPLGD